jgi:hypothetical protein
MPNWQGMLSKVSSVPESTRSIYLVGEYQLVVRRRRHGKRVNTFEVARVSPPPTCGSAAGTGAALHLLDRAKDLLPPLLSTRGCSRASPQTDSSWRRSGALFKMIRRHLGRGCSLGDVDCLGLNLASRDRIQSRQFRTLRRLLNDRLCPTFCNFSL